MSTAAQTVEIALNEHEESVTSAYTAWIVITCGMVVALATLIVVFNVWMDVFGLYWRATANIYILERYSDHLLSYRYIPNHYQEILLGNSVTADWDTQLIRGHHIFNLSARSSNMHEQRVLADQLIQSGRMRNVFIDIHPTMMSKTEIPTAYLTDKDRQSALGSVQLCLVYIQILREALFHPESGSSRSAHRFFSNGGMEFPISRTSEFVIDRNYFDIQSGDIADLRAILAECRERRVRVYLVIVPTYEPDYVSHRAEFDSYYREIERVAGSDAIVLDLNSDPSIRGFRSDRANFPDRVHTPQPFTGPVLAALSRQLLRP